MVVRGLFLAVLAMGAAAGARPAAGATPATGLAAVQIAGPVLMVSDLERSLRFYVEGLGLATGTRLPGPPGPGVTVIAAPGSPAPFLLLQQRAATPTTDKVIEPGNGLSRVMLLASDSRAVAARLDAAGYAHTPVSEGRIFLVTDPDGYRYEIMQRDSRH